MSFFDLKIVLDKVKTSNDILIHPPSKTIINGLVIKNASLSSNNFLEESNLREFEYKIPTSYFIISKKNYRCPIEVNP